MAAYVIARLEVRSTTWLAKYGPKTAALIEKHSGKYLVRGGTMEGLEDDGELPSTIVVLGSPPWSTPRPGTTILPMHP